MCINLIQSGWSLSVHVYSSFSFGFFFCWISSRTYLERYISFPPFFWLTRSVPSRHLRPYSVFLFTFIDPAVPFLNASLFLSLSIMKKAMHFFSAKRFVPLVSGETNTNSVSFPTAQWTCTHKPSQVYYRWINRPWRPELQTCRHISG